MIRNFAAKTPTVEQDVWIDPAATVIGSVVLEQGASVWPGAVLRGDVQQIHIGRWTNLQDGVIVHVNQPSEQYPQGLACQVGREVTVGHRAILHACRIEDYVLVGMGAIVMDEAVVESDVIIGAGSIVPPKKRLESGHLYLGSPARKVRALTDDERAHLRESASFYHKLAMRHRREIEGR
ncbi:MAG TPA: gamma carbonic anhydrase family protein [Halothiobacillaceae bacterium]|nr:gamma carbonic anhydrase family protein [Halothiobacillaceae bacterium]